MPENLAEILRSGELAGVFAGEWFEGSGQRVLAFTRDAVRHGEDLRRRTGTSFAVRTARYTSAELDAVADRVAADADLLEAEGVQVLISGTDIVGNRYDMELVTATPAETLLWLYERYGDAIRPQVLGPRPYVETLAHATGFREAERGVELRYGPAGRLLGVDVVERGDVVAVGIREDSWRGARTAIYREEWALAELAAPLGGRPVRDAASGRDLPRV